MSRPTDTERGARIALDICDVKINQRDLFPSRRAPSLKFSWVMRPPTSGRIITPWRERRLPTVWVSSVMAASRTLAASTAGGRPAAAGAEAPCAAGAATTLASPCPALWPGRWF